MLPRETSALELDYPTPLRRLDTLSSEHAEVWLKDDGRIHPLYGGNKVRKMAELLRAARARGVRRVLTFGPGGSHHVLASTLFSRAHGLECAAVLFPQPAGNHAIETLRAGLGAGLSPFPAASSASIPLALARAFRKGDLIVPPGGASTEGAAAYSRGFDELLAQFAARNLPPPDCVVLALGSGGTAAGLLAGVALNRVPTVIHAVSVVRNPIARFWVTELAARVVSRAGGHPDREALLAQLSVDRRHLGRGYGHGTDAGSAAIVRAAESGVALDATYTAKAFARVLDLTRDVRRAAADRPLRIVYWHTLSAAPFEPLLARAPRWEELPRELQALFK